MDSLPWFPQRPRKGWGCTAGLALSNCTLGVCQMMMWAAQRSPELLQCSEQLDIYYLQKQMIKDLTSSAWTTAPHCCSPIKVHHWMVPRGTGIRSQFLNVKITHSETLSSSHNLRCSPLKCHCLGPRAQKYSPCSSEAVALWAPASMGHRR